MTKPNFFIVGAPKCATTAMSTYLASHPEVYFSQDKEPFFFGSDLDHTWRKRRGLDEYMALFSDATDEKRVGEGSTFYLFSRTAAREIYAFNKDACIIIMLRSPADMMYSLHGQFLYSANEDLTEFETALAAQDERRGGRRIPAGAYFPQGLQYFQVARFSGQVDRYFTEFGREHVHVVIYDDLQKDASATSAAVLDFLGLSREGAPRFQRLNQGRSVRNTAARRLVSHPHVRRMASFEAYVPWASARRGLVELRGRVRKTFDDLTAPVTLRPAMRTETRVIIAKEFEGEVEKLSRLLDRDLSHWCNL